MKNLASPAMVRLRSLARALRLPRLISGLTGVFEQGRVRQAREHYRRHGPDSATLRIDDLEVRLAVATEEQYLGALAFEKDAHLIRQILGQLPPDRSFWDVGANVGAYSCFVATHLRRGGGRVFAFEPEPGCRARLLRNVELNGLDNVTVQPFALSDRPASMSFAPQPGGTTGHLVADPEERVEGLIRVDVKGGDQARRELGLDSPWALKIDAEGYELEILRGLRATLADPGCRFVLVEVHFSLLERRGLTDAPALIENELREAGFGSLSWADLSHLAASKGDAGSADGGR